MVKIFILFTTGYYWQSIRSHLYSTSNLWRKYTRSSYQSSHMDTSFTSHDSRCTLNSTSTPGYCHLLKSVTNHLNTLNTHIESITHRSIIYTSLTKPSHEIQLPTLKGRKRQLIIGTILLFSAVTFIADRAVSYFTNQDHNLRDLDNNLKMEQDEMLNETCNRG